MLLVLLVGILFSGCITQPPEPYMHPGPPPPCEPCFDYFGYMDHNESTLLIMNAKEEIEVISSSTGIPKTKIAKPADRIAIINANIPLGTQVEITYKIISTGEIKKDTATLGEPFDGLQHIVFINKASNLVP